MFDQAARIYREVLESMPDEGGLLMNLGMALAMGGHEADAVAPLERAIALKPGLIPAQMFLGSSYLALGRPADAIAPLKRAVAAKASDVESRRMLARAYAETGRPMEAVTQLRAVTDLAPKLSAGWYALGHAYNSMTQDAMQGFDDQPEDSPWRQLLVADALLADGRLTDAFALQRATLERLPSMVSIHDSIARIYELSGHADWATTERARGVLVLALGAVSVARVVAGRKYNRHWTTHNASFPVPFPLSGAELEALRAERVTAGAPAGDPLAGVDLNAAALACAISRGEHLVKTRVGCNGCHGADLGGRVLIDQAVVGYLSSRSARTPSPRSGSITRRRTRWNHPSRPPASRWAKGGRRRTSSGRYARASGRTAPTSCRRCRGRRTAR